MSYYMADGTTAFDPRLGRLKEFDSRSLNFPARDLLTKKQWATPRPYTWSCPIRLDQGQTPSCVGNGFTHEAAARPKVWAGLTEATAQEVYSRAQQLDQWPGESYEGTSVLGGVKAGKERGWYGGYRWCFSVEDMVGVIGYGGPVVIGVDWYNGMMDVDEKGYVHLTGGVAGGHCVMVNGVQVAAQRFRVTNSWGAGWGFTDSFGGGQCWIAWDDMARLLKADGEACVITSRNVQPV